MVSNHTTVNKKNNMVQNNFLTYCNTRQFFTNNKNGNVYDNSFYLTDKELQRYNLTRAQFESMPQINTVGMNRYNIVGVSDIDITLIKPHGRQLTNLHKYMLQCVVSTDLPTTVQTTPYWNIFKKHRKQFAELFFTVDEFSGRVHTPISRMRKEFRPMILLRNEKTVSQDVFQMQPTLLGEILRQAVGENSFSTAINEGKDIYLELMHTAKLKSRDEAKKRFFQILFGKPNEELKQLFNDANWINWINWYKAQTDPRNPHNKEKPYSNLAFLLQTYEVNIMSEIWQKLAQKNIPYLTVHDEIIARQTDTDTVKTTIESVLNKHFKSYKLNIDKLETKQVQLPAEPINKKSFFDIGMDILGEQNNMTKNRLLSEMIKRYNITDSRAEKGFELLLNNGIIEATNVDTYFMKHSTPY
jgi:hypothetical protein